MAISRRTVVAGAAAGALAPRLSWAADDGVGAPVAPKVLRYAFEVAETSLDPAKINDLYSRTLTPHIFEGLYTYDHLARPVKIKPLTADGMPQHSDDFRVWTARVRPGIYFADDPAFKGKRRELVAQDYVYSWKRFADPARQMANAAELTAGLKRLAQRHAIDEDGDKEGGSNSKQAGLIPFHFPDDKGPEDDQYGNQRYAGGYQQVVTGIGRLYPWHS